MSRSLQRAAPRALRWRSGEQRAAVLVPIVNEDEAAPTLILERRTDHLPSHAGQYAFPGGVAEESDRSEVETALREAREEIGLDPARVHVLGALSDVRTPTGYVISPVVGLVDGPVELTPSPDEVAFLVRPPLSVLFDDGAFRMVVRRARGVLIRGEALVWEGHEVWGATARMLLALRRVLRSVAGPWR